MKHDSQKGFLFFAAVICLWDAPCFAVEPRVHIDQCTSGFAALSISFRQSESLGDLDAAEVAMIQSAVDGFGHPLYVTGSAARSERRGKGTTLPLAEFGESKSHTRSDIDYLVENGLDGPANALKLPDMDPSFGVREVDYLDLDKGPVIRFRPQKPPEIISGSGRLYLVEKPD